MQPTPRRQPDKRLLAVLVAIMGLGWLAFNAWSLERYPAVSCDEAFYGRYALRFVEAVVTGETWPPPGQLFFLAYGRTYWLLLGGALKLWGPQLGAARMVSVLGWALTVLATLWLGQRWAGEARVGRWAAALVAVSWTALWPGHFTRPDALAVAASTAVLALAHLAWTRSEAWLVALLGFALVVPLDLHPITLFISAAAALLTATHLLRERAWPRLGWLALGALAGAAAFAWLHLGSELIPVGRLLLADPGEFLRTQNLAGSAGGGSLPLAARLPDALGWLAGFWWRFYAWYTPWLSLPFGLLFAGGLVWALADPDSGDLRALAAITIISTVLFGIVNAHYTAPVGYALLWLPLYAVMGVAAVERLAGWLASRLPPHLRRLPLATLALAGFAASYAAGTLYLAATPAGDAYEEGASQLRASIEPGSRVLAASTWWYALSDGYVLVDEYLLEPQGSVLWWNASPDPADYRLPDLAFAAPGEVTAGEASGHVTAGIEGTLHPDYILDDGVMGCLIDRTPLGDALSAYAARTCTPLDTVTADGYGTTTVYWCGGADQPPVER